MKTNNVDFGKSFKLKAKLYDTIYTCHSVGDTGRCKVTWTEDGEDGSTSYKASTIAEYIRDGDWIVLPTDMKEIVGDIGPELSFQTNTKITDTLLNEIKAFTTTSKHSVNIYKGAYEVFRSGEDMAYQCKDNTSLRSVMQALKVLDGVSVDGVIHE